MAVLLAGHWTLHKPPGTHSIPASISKPCSHIYSSAEKRNLAGWLAITVRLLKQVLACRRGYVLYDDSLEPVMMDDDIDVCIWYKLKRMHPTSESIARRDVHV